MATTTIGTPSVSKSLAIFFVLILAIIPFPPKAILMGLKPVTSGGSVKTAIVMHKLDVSKQDAEQRLQDAGGFLSKVIEKWTGIF